MATSLLGPMPTEQVSCVVLLDVREQTPHRRSRRVQAREVEIGLVEADDLDALDVRAHEIHDALGDGAIGLEVGRQEDRLRAQPPRARAAGIAEPTPYLRAS